jgi:hypothetical protein
VRLVRRIVCPGRLNVCFIVFFVIWVMSLINYSSLIGSHTRGSTKEKAHKLDELKAKRKAKDDKKRVCRLGFFSNEPWN